MTRRLPRDTPLAGLVHGINGLWRPCDCALFAPAVYAASDPVFLVGAPRSGTTLAFQVLTHALQMSFLPRALDHAYGGSHLFFRLFLARLQRQPAPQFVSDQGVTPGIFSPSESFGFWRQWFQGLSSDACLEPLPDEQVKSLQRAVYSIQGHARQPLLVKCLYLSLAIPALIAAFPRARFIWVIRDPVAVAASVLRIRQSHPELDWWSVRPPGYQQHMNEPLEDQVMWQLAETLRLLRAALHDVPLSQWQILRYEDVCAGPQQQVDMMAHWLSSTGCKPYAEQHMPERFMARSVVDDALRARLQQSVYYPHVQEAMP
ncbi:MAG TPA: sulfotransferase [Pseudomonadales bacterium]